MDYLVSLPSLILLKQTFLLINWCFVLFVISRCAAANFSILGRFEIKRLPKLMKNVSVCIININTILHICSGTLENLSQTFFKFQLHFVWTCQICNALLTNARESSAFLLVMWQISFDLIINEKKHNYLKHCDLAFCITFRGAQTRR